MAKERTPEETIDWYRQWYQADLSYLLRPGGQARLDAFIEDCRAREPGSARPIAAECHRRLGKSFNAIRRAVQRCLRAPRTIAKIGAPTKELARDIVELDLADLLEDCPPAFQPRTVGDKFYWHNPAWKSSKESMLHVVGLDHKKGNLMRGTGMDFCAIDEAGYVEHLEYIMRSIIAPQFDRTDDPEYLIMSTPPPNMDHHFVRPSGVLDMAMQHDRHIKIAGSDNPDFTERDKEKWAEAAGVEIDSVEYRREIECEHIADEGRLIVPEWPAVASISTRAMKRPEYFRPWIVMDTGWQDYTAILFCYFDFERQLIVVEDMIWTHYTSTYDLARMFRQKVEELYPPEVRAMLTREEHVRAVHAIRYDFNESSHSVLKDIEKRENWDASWEKEIWNDGLIMIADMTKREVEDFARDYALFFEPAEKSHKFSRVASFRRTIQKGQWRINKKTCGPLVYQLENGLLNEKRTDFERGEAVGHCDALAAAIYLNAMMAWNDNPFPAPVVDKDIEFVLDPTKYSESSWQIQQAFGID